MTHTPEPNRALGVTAAIGYLSKKADKQRKSLDFAASAFGVVALFAMTFAMLAF